MSKWDKDNKINNIIDSLLQVLDDEKPTIVRQCLSSLNNLLLYKFFAPIVEFDYHFIESKTPELALKKAKK